jgi:hypothetical protein
MQGKEHTVEGVSKFTRTTFSGQYPLLILLSTLYRYSDHFVGRTAYLNISHMAVLSTYMHLLFY